MVRFPAARKSSEEIFYLFDHASFKIKQISFVVTYVVPQQVAQAGLLFSFRVVKAAQIVTAIIIKGQKITCQNTL